MTDAKRYFGILNDIWYIICGLWENSYWWEVNNWLCIMRAALDTFVTEKPVARRFRIVLEFRNVGFWVEGEPENLEKRLSGQERTSTEPQHWTKLLRNKVLIKLKLQIWYNSYFYTPLPPPTHTHTYMNTPSPNTIPIINVALLQKWESD